jgi:hypothetical protein
LSVQVASRGDRVGLNSVSVPIDGFPANYLHGGEHHAAAASARPQK